MTTMNRRVRWVVLLSAAVLAAALTAVATAWPQPRPRQEPPPLHQPLEPVEIGGPSQAGLHFPA